jgi:hypothetical protein
MPRYRLVYLNAAGAPQATDEFETRDEDEAIRMARASGYPEVIELWLSGEFVRRLDPISNSPEASRLGLGRTVTAGTR